jgi:hypothetical protein
VRVSGLKGKNQVQGQVLVTWTQVDIILLESAQEPEWRKCLANSGNRTVTVKKYF